MQSMSPHCRHHAREDTSSSGLVTDTHLSRGTTPSQPTGLAEKEIVEKGFPIKYFQNIPTAKLKGDYEKESPAPIAPRAGSHGTQAFPPSSPCILIAHNGFLDTLTPQLPISNPSPASLKRTLMSWCLSQPSHRPWQMISREECSGGDEHVN